MTITEQIDVLLEAKRSDPKKDLKAALRAMRKAAKANVHRREQNPESEDTLTIKGVDAVEDAAIKKAAEAAGFKIYNARVGQLGYYWWLTPPDDWVGWQRTKAVQAGNELLRKRGYVTAIYYWPP